MERVIQQKLFQFGQLLMMRLFALPNLMTSKSQTQKAHKYEL